MKKLSRGAKHSIILLIVTLIAGIGYYLLIKNTGFSFGCAIRQLSGFKCPSCGITHMFTSLFQLDFASAFRYNPLMFIMWPFVGIEVLYVTYMGGNSRELPKWNYVVIYVMVGISILFGIIRNVVNI